MPGGPDSPQGGPENGAPGAGGPGGGAQSAPTSYSSVKEFKAQMKAQFLYLTELMLL